MSDDYVDDVYAKMDKDFTKFISIIWPEAKKPAGMFTKLS